MKKRLNLALASVLALGVLAACSDPDAPGSVAGTISRAVPEAEGESLGASSVPLSQVVPGSLFISFGAGTDAASLSGQSALAAEAQAAGFSFDREGNFTFDSLDFELKRSYPGGTGLGLYSVPGLSERATRDLVKQLKENGFVVSAFPNIIVETQEFVPDDPLYELQAWQYEQLNLPAAWEMVNEAGSETVNVAIIDTGSLPHPDLDWAPGVNMVGFWSSDPNDSDGMDFDDPTTPAIGSDHGTHVGGTIGALSNNGAGVAGVSHNVNLVPVKTLNAQGSGSFDDILEGVLWAAGFDFEEYGGYVNPNPAHVINMSLGGILGEACPPEIDMFFQEAYNNSGAITVVSAGNDTNPTDGYFPANCPSVVTVGATGPTGARAYYSNYGPHVDVMAPGGDAMMEHPADPDYSAQVLSTIRDGYGFMQGTSMASPHVAGVVALLLGQEPGLSVDEVKDRLRDGSRPLSLEECSTITTGQEGLNLCGAGIVDAVAVLDAETVTTSAAVAYAIPFEGEAPEIALGDLGSIAKLASNSTDGVANGDGSFDYSFDSLAPGDYLIVAIELLNEGEGVGSTDRFGTAEVTVAADTPSTADVEVEPVWLLAY